MLIVTGTPGTYAFRGVPTVAETEFTEGVLTGVTASKQISEGYVLQTLSGVTGFYHVNAERPVTMPAYRAWLNYEDTGVKMLGIDFATGMSGIGHDGSEAAQYDLGGRRVNKPDRRGIYVSEGKKRLKTNK